MTSVMTGKYNHTLDQKSRVSVPSQLRKKIGEIVYLTVSDGDYLFGYTEEGWTKYNKLLDLIDEDDAAFIRGNTSECVIDAQGRISIPQDLREFAGLETEVVIQGDGDKIRLWKAESFAKHNAKMSPRENVANIRMRTQALKGQLAE